MLQGAAGAEKYPRLSVNILITLVQDNKDELLALGVLLGKVLRSMTSLCPGER
jgi:hypothetical protein